MSRALIVLIVVVVVLIGGLVFLSSVDTTREPTRVEKAVSLENLAK